MRIKRFGIWVTKTHDNKNVFEQVNLDLGPGTVLLVDNWRVTHSRTAYAGHRLVLILACLLYLCGQQFVCQFFLISYCASLTNPGIISEHCLVVISRGLIGEAGHDVSDFFELFFIASLFLTREEVQTSVILLNIDI